MLVVYVRFCGKGDLQKLPFNDKFRAHLGLTNGIARSLIADC